MKKVLILEDEVSIRSFVVINLKRAGYEAIEAGTGMEALEQLKNNPDVGVAILDIMLPDIDGFEVCRNIRATNKQIGIIMLTARSQEMDKVTGLMTGADDYITKPFSLSVLRARVNTQLRKKMIISLNTPIRIDHFCFDFGTMTFFVGDVKVELSKTEQKLLHLLVENRGHTMARGDLVDRIWTDGAEYVDENALSVTVKRLRDKLGAQEYIKTVYGIGYSWVKKDE